MGESSTPRRPTHDTNTSRRQVNTQTHTSSPTPPPTTLHQIETHYEVYWIDCIYFDASSCCYGFNSFRKVHCISRTSKLLQSLHCKMHVLFGRCNSGGDLQSSRGRHGLGFLPSTTGGMP